MNVRGLGYVGVRAVDLDAWRPFATEILGAMAVEPDFGDAGTLHLKLDDRTYRVAVHAGETDGLAYLGWEVANAADLSSAAQELAAAGVAATEGSEEEAAARGVQGLIRFKDPCDNDLELFYGPVLDHAAFASPAGVSRFVTGDLGVGHVVLFAGEYDEMKRFYLDILGFRVSDTMGIGPFEVAFLHCNARHHSLAVADVPGASGLQHIMIEVGSLDDVGYAYDRCQDAGMPLTTNIGKHTNDHMVSFYVKTPSGFDIEYGCGGRHIDDQRWTVTRLTKPSLWGHRGLVA